MGGVKLIAIEAKCFDFLLEEGGRSFLLQIVERRRGFITSLLLGRDASLWLLSIFKDKALFAGPSFTRRFEGDGKVIIVHWGQNKQGHYVSVTEFFGNGRRASIFVPKGHSFAGWNHFSRALSELLAARPSKRATFHSNHFSSHPPHRHLVEGLSFSDVVKKGVVEDTKLLRIEVTPDGKRLVRWVSRDDGSKGPKSNVFSRLGPKRSIFSRLGPSPPASQGHQSLPSTRIQENKVTVKQIWVPKVKDKSQKEAAPSSPGMAMLASDKVESPPCQNGSLQAEGCTVVSPKQSPLKMLSHTGNIAVTEKVVAPTASSWVSDSDLSSDEEVSDTDLSLDSEDLDEDGLLIHSLQQLEHEYPNLDHDSSNEDKGLEHLDKDLEGVADLFEQRDGTEDDNLPSGLEVGVNSVRNSSDQILALAYTGSDPFPSRSPSNFPSENPLFPTLSPSCVQNSLVLSGDKVEYSSQGDGLLPSQERNLNLISHDIAIKDKVEESFQTNSCLNKAQNDLCSHPLIQELGLKVINPEGISRPIVDSPITYSRKKKRLVRELNRLSSSLNYGGKVGRRAEKVSS